jgi:6-phosphogluconolactonase
LFPGGLNEGLIPRENEEAALLFEEKAMPKLKKKASPAKTKKSKTKTIAKKKTLGRTVPLALHKTKIAKPKAAGFHPETRIYPTPETLFQEMTHLVMQTAREAVNERGRFVVALSGGSTPKGLFQQMTEEPYMSLIPWAKTFVFWVDERHVPLTHETSNYRMTQEFLLSKAPIPKEQVFPASNGTLTVEQAASAYEIKLGKFFGTGAFPRFDMALMGMGDDGHTASLFPGVPQVNELERWVVGYFVDEARKERVSLTFPVLNASRLLLVLLEGQKKAERLKDVLEGGAEPPRYPVQYLRPTDGKLIFAMDAAAASLLKKNS